LYRQPRILFLDEGTAHLDIENEQQINNSLKQMKMTRVSVAHRPDITAGADRVIRIARTIQQSAPKLVAFSAERHSIAPADTGAL